MKVSSYFKARYPFLWIQTTEEERTIRAHRAELKDDVSIYSWDIVSGFRTLAPNGEPGSWTWKKAEPEPTQAPSEALEKVLSLPERSIIYCKDFHIFAQEIQISRRILNLKDILKATARMIVFISCAGASAIPQELKNDITLFNQGLPTKAELIGVINRAYDANKNKLKLEAPAGEELNILSNALIGLTEEAAENSTAACLVENRRFDPRFLMREKSRIIKAEGLTYQEYNESFDDLFGLEIVKGYVLKVAPEPNSSAVLLYGVPGAGKSHLAKALGNALQWPVLSVNFGNMRGKYQGDLEGRLENFFQTINALGRVIIFADEFDKSIAGSQGGADSDAGAGARMVGRILQELEDKRNNPEGPYWLFTCNSLSDLLNISGGALMRRMDAAFFLDLPTARERAGIVKIWNRKEGVEIPPDFDTNGFTGADIAKLARTMQMMKCSAKEARKYIIPTAQVLGDKIREIRLNAASTCINASLPEDESAPTGRKLDI